MKKFKILSAVLAVLCVLLTAAAVWLHVDGTNRLAKAAQTQEETLAQLRTEHAQEISELQEAQEQAVAQLHEAQEQALAEQEQTITKQLQEEKEQAIGELKEEQAEYLAQFKLYKNIISQDEVEQTLFGQPISAERDGEYRIGIKTSVDGDFHAELTIYQAKDGAYEKVFSCPAVVGKNGPGKQSEGDTKTPLGTWTVGEAYGINDDPGSLIPYTKVTEDMYWCATGSNGKKYNTLISSKDDPDADYSEDEHLIDYPVVYNYLLDLGYNRAGAPYAGNAIFLHCWRGPDNPTGGCVGVAEESMVEILKTITPGTAVTIY